MVTDFEEIYERKQSRMTVDSDKRDQRAITEWLTRGVPEKATSNTKRLAKELAKPDIIKKEIDDIEFKKTIDEEEQLRPIEREINTIKIDSARREVRAFAEEKKRELKQERLIEEGKTTTFFRSQIREATTEGEIRDILSEAEEVLGEGKNLQSLRIGAEALIRELE